MRFDELSAAVRARDVIRKFAEKEASKLPGAKTFIGRVVHVDTVAMRASVWIPGDDQPVPVRLIQGAVPATWYRRSAPTGAPNTDTQGYGSTVVLQEYQGQLYIVDILTGGTLTANHQALGLANVELRPWNIGSGQDVVGQPNWSRLSVLATSLGQEVNVGGAVMFGPFMGQLNTGMTEITITSGNYAKKYTFALQRNAFDLMGSPELEKWYRILPEQEVFDDEGDDVLDWDLDIAFRRTADTKNAAGVQSDSIWLRIVNSSQKTGGAEDPFAPAIIFNHSVTIDSTIFSRAQSPAGRFICEVTQSASQCVGYVGFRGGSTPYPDLAAQYAMAEFGRPALSLGAADTGETWSNNGVGSILPNGDAAVITPSGANQLITAQLTPSITFGDLETIDAFALVSISNVATGNAFSVGPIWRASPTTGYAGHLVFNTDGSVGWAIRRYSGSTVTDIATGSTGLEYDPGERFGVNCRMSGTQISIKIWKYDTAQETDATWHIATDATYGSAGDIGISGYVPSGSTNHLDGRVVYVHTWRGGYGGSPGVSRTREVNSSPWRSPRLRLANDLQKTAYSTGRLSWDGRHLSWGEGESIILGGVGRHKDGLAEGRAYCIMPSVGFTIPRYPHGDTVTVTDDGIPLSQGQALWLSIPPGTKDEELSRYLFIVDETQFGVNFGVPEWSMLVASVPAGTEALVPGVSQPEAPFKPYARMIQIVEQIIPNISAPEFTPLTFTKEIVDTHNGHSNVTNTSRYYATEDGLYELTGGAYFEASSGGRMLVAWAKNGNYIEGSQSSQLMGSAGSLGLPARTTWVNLIAGDYVELVVYNSHTSSISTRCDLPRERSSMNVRWIAPISDVFDETPEEPPVGPSPGSGSFIPIETRSYRPSSWRSDNQYVYQGQWEGAGIHYGCAFFGNQLSDLGAVTVTDIRVKIKRRNAGGWTAAQPLRLAIFTNKVKPAGAPTVHATIAGPSLAWGQEVEFVLPNSWGQLLVDGTCGAVGLYEADGDPYVITEGKATYADAWKLTMTWTA